MKPTTDRVLASIYRSSARQDMYLYVSRHEGLTRVPEPLRERFGTPIPVMDLLLTPARTLARVEVDKVMAKIVEQGYYLQMPPPREEGMLDLYREPTTPVHPR